MHTLSYLVVSLVVVAGQGEARRDKSANEATDKPVPNILPYLQDFHEFCRAKNQGLPQKLGARAVPQVIKALDHPDVWVPQQAVEWLAIVGPVTDDVIPALIRLARKKQKLSMGKTQKGRRGRHIRVVTKR